jgi:hypothetical protein
MGDRKNGRATRSPVFEFAGLVFRTKCLAKMAEVLLVGEFWGMV